MEAGAVKIQAAIRGRKTRKEIARQNEAATRMQANVRGYLSNISTRAEVRRRNVETAIGTKGVAVGETTLKDWLAENGLMRDGDGDGLLGQLEDAGISALEQLAKLSGPAVATLAASMFANRPPSTWNCF